MTETTELVVFQRIYREGVEITAHADREDEGQTVKIHVPEIRTRAAVDGGKTVTAGGKITLEDTVIYRDLIPGRTYVLRGILMDKATRAPFLEDGKKNRFLWCLRACGVTALSSSNTPIGRTRIRRWRLHHPCLLFPTVRRPVTTAASVFGSALVRWRWDA